MEQSKKNLTEEDIKLRLITPAITKKWDPNLIHMEEQITDGKVCLEGNKPVRKEKKKADYVLYLRENNPIAVVEAKNNKRSASDGLQQAKHYAEMLDVPFAYSSNGDTFIEHDYLTGEEREISLEDFPSPDELRARYYKNANGGEGLSEKEISVINQSYYSGQSFFSPRYYQRIAINRTVKAIARGQKRLLLVMATGTGKTYTAFQIVYRLLKSDMVKKVLYLADRNVLVDQSIQQDFKPLEKTIHKINFAKDDPTTVTSSEVYFSLYQQLSDRDDEVSDDETCNRLQSLFQPDFFDLVIVDECHRGSAKADSNWRKILEYFNSATQIGMTATPKEDKDTSNIGYFGEPIYTYSLNNGIEDGFLAPFKVIRISTNIGEGWRPCVGQRDKNGKVIEDREYSNSDYDYNIIIEDRTEEVAKEITNYLKSTGRMQKTIVFCANEDHAARMRMALSNLNSDMVQKHPDYVVRITGSDKEGQKKLDYFISVGEHFPVIATTSKLLSTGVDCKMTRLIVLDQMINSMTEFKQIIGRGTRLREADGKMNFVVMDFRNVSRLFADPKWDGPIEQDEYYSGDKRPYENPESVAPEDEPEESEDTPNQKCIVDKNGCKVNITLKTVSYYDTNGKLLRQESITDYTKSNILRSYSTIDSFIQSWSVEDKKKEIMELLGHNGIDLKQMKADQKMTDVDDFDFICHVAFDKKPLTRRERAENVRKRDFLSRYSGVAREVLDALLDRYADVGIDEIEDTKILTLDPLPQYGKPAKIVNQYFGGKENYKTALTELERALYCVTQ